MSNTDRASMNFIQPDLDKRIDLALDEVIGMLTPKPGVRSVLVTLEGFLRHGYLTPDMNERWATAKAEVQKLAANKELNDRVRRRARIVLEKMEKLAPLGVTPLAG